MLLRLLYFWNPSGVHVGSGGTPTENSILLETGDVLLLETGDEMLLE